MGISLSFVAVCSARVDHLLSGQAPLMLTIGTQDTDVPPQMVQDFYEDFVSEKGMLLCLYSGIYLGFGRCEKPPPSHAELISRRGVHNRRCGPSCETANNKRRVSSHVLRAVHFLLFVRAEIADVLVQPLQSLFPQSGRRH